MLSFVSNCFALGGIAAQVSRVCGHVVADSPPKGCWIYGLGSGVVVLNMTRGKGSGEPPAWLGRVWVDAAAPKAERFRSLLGEQPQRCGRGNRNGENVR